MKRSLTDNSSWLSVTVTISIILSFAIPWAAWDTKPVQFLYAYWERMFGQQAPALGIGVLMLFWILEILIVFQVVSAVINGVGRLFPTKEDDKIDYNHINYTAHD